MNRFDAIRNLIRENPHTVNFAEFGDGTSSGWINRAELAIGFALPPTYKWWLRNYGGGEVGGEEIYSVYCQDFDSVVGGDIVGMYRQRTKNAELVPICQSDIDGVFCFDRSQLSPEGEYPVVSEATGTIYAIDFLEFLKNRIELARGESSA